ncbi:MAG: hypothetical protein FRX49_06978 [Trebouxia sp. A1-2]|nr:MAG: hypothetical protein FRX49_06978 [Trebouxia sp. A1-2]
MLLTSLTSDADSHGSSIAHMGIVGLTEQGHNARALLRHPQQNKAQAQDRRPPHVIRDVTHSKVQQLLDCGIVCRAAVLKDFIVPTAQASQAQPKTGAMLGDLQGSMLTWSIDCTGSGTLAELKDLGHFL